MWPGPLVRPLCRRDASAEVDEILFRNVDVEGAYRGLFPNWTGHGSLLSSVERASIGQRFSLLLGKEDVGSTQHKVSWSTAGALRRAYEWTSIEIFTNVDQLLSFVIELLQSLLEERSENVVRSNA
jgi:hypothetical protein